MARPKNDENGKVSESGFRIRRRVLPSGAAVFLVDLGLVNGKRRRQQFATITAARNHCRLLAVDAERVGLAAFALSDHDREDAVQPCECWPEPGPAYLSSRRPTAPSMARPRQARRFKPYAMTS